MFSDRQTHSDFWEGADQFYNSPLHIAAAQCDKDTINKVKKMEKFNWDLMRKQNSDGYTPLMCARLACIAPTTHLGPRCTWLAAERASGYFDHKLRAWVDSEEGTHYVND